jgi:hypothetical protein
MHKPIYIKINENGDKVYYSDREMKIPHRETGPAVERANGYKAWYLNGKLHRETGPAIEWPDGSKAWYLNGERHREDGPAVEDAYGFKSWWLNGKRHREDGPAVENTDGSKEWYLNDESVTREEHARITHASLKRITQKETVLTLDEITKKLFGVPVEKVRIKK